MGGRGTVKPAKYFNPEREASLLYANLRGFVSDSSATEIIGILSKTTNAQRIETSRTYHEIYDRDLIQDIKSFGGGADFQQTIISSLLSPAEHDAVSLSKAMKGLTKDGRVFTEILWTRSENEIRNTKDVYSAKYHRELRTDIAENFTGHFKTLLLKVASEPRSTGAVSNELARKDAEILNEMRTDNAHIAKVLDIFCSRNLLQLNATLVNYHKLSPDTDIQKKIAMAFQGDIKEALKSIAKLATSSSAFFAEKLFKSMKGVGTDDETLRRIIITRSEIDLLDIKECFKKMYGKSLTKYIAGDTSGSYKKLLIAFVGK